MDEPGIARPQVVHVQAEGTDRLGTQAGQEDIRRFDELEEDLASGVRLQVDRDALRAAIILLHGEVREFGLPPVGDTQRPIGIAGADGFDVDDLRPLIGKQRTGRRHELSAHLDH